MTGCRFVFVVALLCGVYSACLGQNAPRDTLVVFRFENNSADSVLDRFHLLLVQQLEYELLFPNLVITGSDEPYRSAAGEALRARFAVYGRIDPDSIMPEPTITIRIDDMRTGMLHQKKLPLQGMSPEDLARVVVLKTGALLRERALGRLNISSTPAGCEIRLDNVRTGITPREFSLQPGRYTLELGGEYLSPFRGEVEVVEGRPVNLNIHMNFRGYPTLHWLTGAFVCTGMGMIMFVVERSHYREYEAQAIIPLDPPAENNPYMRQYRAYRHAQLVRLAFQHAAVAGWTGTGFCFFINRSIQRRIFGRNN